MKETVRTASVLEIYNEAIAELEKEKQMLIVERTTLQTRGIFATIVKILSFLFGGILIILGIALLSSSEEIGIWPLLLGGLFLFLSIKIKKNRDRIKTINGRLAEINKEIKSREIKKKDLLREEENILAKDTTTKNFSSEPEITPASFESEKRGETKICPMCAETIKSAAIICRYCGYKFVSEPIENNK
jgi:hypothetical protein